MQILKIEAKVVSSSPIEGKTVEEINSQYGVTICGLRNITSGVMERSNPPKDSIIKANDYLEFSGDSEKVVKLFRICEGSQ